MQFENSPRFPNDVVREKTFLFRKKNEHINWRKLAAIDIEQIVSKLDIAALQDNLQHLAFCNIDKEFNLHSSTDPNFIKMFKLSQLTIEYLLHSQEFLANKLQASYEKQAEWDQQLDRMQTSLHEKNRKIAELRHECQRRHKLILAQQQLMESGPDAYHPCPFCDKAFMTAEFLHGHVHRRHAGGCEKMSGAGVGEVRRTSSYLQKSSSPSFKSPTQFAAANKENRVPHRLNSEEDRSERSGRSVKHAEHNLTDRMKHERETIMNEIDQKFNSKLQEELDKARQENNELQRQTQLSKEKEAEIARQKALQSNKNKNWHDDESNIRSKPRRVQITDPSNEQMRQSFENIVLSPRSPSRSREFIQRVSIDSKNGINDEPDLVGQTGAGMDRERTSKSFESLKGLMSDQTPDLGSQANVRTLILGLFEEYLEELGIDRNETKLSKEKFDQKVQLLNHEREHLRSKFGRFEEIRAELKQKLNRLADERINPVRNQNRPQIKYEPSSSDEHSEDEDSQSMPHVSARFSDKLSQRNSREDYQDGRDNETSEWITQSSPRKSAKNIHLNRDPIYAKISSFSNQRHANTIINNNDTNANTEHQKFGSNRQRMSSDFDETNTYPTDVWPQSKGVSTVNPVGGGGGQKSVVTNKSSDIGGEDFEMH